MPTPPGRYEEHLKPPLLVYWDSKMVVEAGRELIGFMRLREGASSTNMICTRCDSVMVVDHPFYEGNSVLTFPEFITVEQADIPKPTIRFYVKDWPDAEVAKLEPLPGVYKEADGGLAGDVQSPALAAIMAAKAAEPAPGPGETFNQLLAACGGECESLDLPRGARSHRE